MKLTQSQSKMKNTILQCCALFSIPALKIKRSGSELKVDRHPLHGRARIKIDNWSLEDDGWGGEEMEHESAVMILSYNDCINLRDHLNEMIEKGVYCCREDRYFRCEKQCSDCERIQAGLPV